MELIMDRIQKRRSNLFDTPLLIKFIAGFIISRIQKVINIADSIINE
jgi:hypothetical protein